MIATTPRSGLAPALFLSALLFAITAAAQPLPPWEDPQVTGINKLPPHAPVYPFDDAVSARALARTQSPYYRLLNGAWRFHFSPTPDARPLRFHEVGFDDGAWETIPVPANIEKHGYAPPIYVNIGYAWGWGTPPRVPHDQNYVGSYRHAFEVPAAWSGRRVRLTFEGVSAGFYVWVNGQSVGYSEDSRGAAEFDVTDAAAGAEPAGGRGLPPHRRVLPRVPGLLASLRHLPQRRPLVDPSGARRRLPGGDRPRRAVPGRDAGARRVGGECGA